VKPYIPYDIVPSSYKLSMATTANGSKLLVRDLVVPDWIVGDVVFSWRRGGGVLI